jgi:hypothetical protein
MLRNLKLPPILAAIQSVQMLETSTLLGWIVAYVVRYIGRSTVQVKIEKKKFEISIEHMNSKDTHLTNCLKIMQRRNLHAD